ncbi:hypothetical protein LshimejAT787_0800080 [Lyophyllum shimeji]|uniref:Uncharacterized protein n=1 Tax=Lyophyllum shimeji TaxID=47721 RepID=A0A9P3UPB0_LYOSH|nr:hypothetical protein LshimejAT787_0800080 [Lyophyllum shimeji]
MLYKNSLPLLIDDQDDLTSIGCPVFAAKIRMSKRTSWPPEITDTVHLTCEKPTPNMHTCDLDHSDTENIHIFLYPSPPVAVHKVATSGPRIPKDGRQIPNRSLRSRPPSVRMPPPDLWAFTPSKTSRGLALSTPSSEIVPASTSSSWTQQPHFHHRPTSEREPLRTMSQAPIGFERHTWSSTAGAGSSSTPVSSIIPHALPPEPCATPVKKLSEPAPTAFVDVLSENKRRNPYAPAMVSMFNPLREKIPFRAWACMPACSRQLRGSNGTPSLPSARYRTSLFAIPVRARKECEWACSALSKGKEHWLNRTRNHCSHCRHETLCKKLLVFSYLNRQAQFLYGPMTPRADNNDDDMEIDDQKAELDDEDLLDSPTLRDFDDFDDFGDENFGDDALLHDQEDVKMGSRVLF